MSHLAPRGDGAHVPEEATKSVDTSDLIVKIIEEIKHDLSDEEIVHLLIDQKSTLQNPKKAGKLTFGQRAADAVANFAGSWGFIGMFALMLGAWIALNAFFSKQAFDPYPFILLNLILSTVAAIQAPLIMMSQNRREEKDRERAESDYRVNLKTEIIIEDLHQKIDELTTIQAELKQMHEDFKK